MAVGRVEQKVEQQLPAKTAELPKGFGGQLLSEPGPYVGAPERVALQAVPSNGQIAITDGNLYKTQFQAKDIPTAPEAASDKTLPFFNKGVSPEVASKVQAAIDHLPPKVQQILKDQGAQVYAFKNIREYDKAFGTHDAELVVDGNRLAAGDAASLNEPSAHPPRIAIFEETLNGERVDKTEDIGGLTRHELGHIVTNPMIPNQDLSNNWDKKLVDIAFSEGSHVPERVQNGPLSHYFSSPAELCAETFAMGIGGGSNKNEDALLRRYFPKTIAYMLADFNT